MPCWDRVSLFGLVCLSLACGGVEDCFGYERGGMRLSVRVGGGVIRKNLKIIIINIFFIRIDLYY